jgi:hypothetical protein
VRRLNQLLAALEAAAAGEAGSQQAAGGKTRAPWSAGLQESDWGKQKVFHHAVWLLVVQSGILYDMLAG